MKLREFFNGCPRGYQAQMARNFGFTVSYLGQLAKGTVPCSPTLALQIERYTQEVVTRADLLPHKWQTIWPDYQPPGDRADLAQAA